MVAGGALKGLKASVLVALHKEPLMRGSLRSAAAGVCLLLGLQAVVLMDARGSGGCVVGGAAQPGDVQGVFPPCDNCSELLFPSLPLLSVLLCDQECNPG